METMTKQINRILRYGAGKGLTRLQFFEREIATWKSSRERHEQLLGMRYYSCDQDILTRKRMAIGEDGKLREVDNLPNNRIVDNQYAKMVDQKVNYLLGKPLTFDTEDEAYEEALKEVFDVRFQRTLRNVGEGSLNGAIGWLHPYYDAEGRFRFMRFDPYDVLPFWKDVEHTMLDCAVRLYEAYEGTEAKRIERVEIYDVDGVERYILDSGKLRSDVDNPGGPYAQLGEKAFHWGRIPLIPFRYNGREIPLIRRVKSLQDAINEMRSDFQNVMQEDGNNTIIILKGYDGESLGEFRHNLTTYRAVKVSGTSQMQGDVDTIQVEVNAENYRTILSELKKALIENARGYDAKDDRIGGQPNQMNIQSMYSDIDLDASGMEIEYQAAMEELLWFVNRHFENVGQAFTSTKVHVIFNKDILINETEVIENVRRLVGILSRESLIKQIPWTEDVQQEMERIEQEERQTFEDEYQGAFARGQPEEAVDGKRTA